MPIFESRMNPTETPNEALELARDFVRNTEANLFLTGKAGTGKTTFLHSLKAEHCKRMIVTAPTGVAAINAGGVTIHSFFQLPFGPQVLEAHGQTGGTPEQRLINRFNRDKINIIRSLDLLIIDEISMVRADLLDAVDGVLRRFRSRNKPFGGVQLLMIGDLHQLAPVVKESDWDILKNHYESPYFFSSKALRKTGFVCIELEHIYRQRDNTFINLLNSIRENRLDKTAINLLNSRYQPDFMPDLTAGYITLTTHNQQALRINTERMNSIDQPGCLFEAEVSGDFPPLSYPNEPHLLLKPGAQVMFVKNDASREKRYYNGKIGVITNIEDGLVEVQCPDDDEPIITGPIEWHNYAYTIDKQTEEIIETLLGTFTQLPLKPAWAITIHKSQGLTFDKAVIDAGAAFAHGQVYVAMSRCRTLEGLVLTSRIDQRCLKEDVAIDGFMQEMAVQRPDRDLLSTLTQQFEYNLLIELNDFWSLIRSIEHLEKLVREHATALTGLDPDKLVDLKKACRKELVDVASVFSRQLKRLFDEQPDLSLNTHLQERLVKACAYYASTLDKLKEQSKVAFLFETDNKAIKKSFSEGMERWLQEWQLKKACLATIDTGFQRESYLRARATAALDKGVAAKKQAMAEQEAAWTETQMHPDVYLRLKQWRDQQAGQLHLPPYLILPGKTLMAIANLLPRNLEQLKRIKGIGKKKLEQYGVEILRLINTKNA